MQFLKTLFWMAFAFSLAVFATRNWRDVTVDLWGPFAADIKLPLLMGIMLLLGWLPTWLIGRSRLWQLKRKLLLLERPVPPSAESDRLPATPAPLTRSEPFE